MSDTFNFSRIARRAIIILMATDLLLLATTIICIKAHISCSVINVYELHGIFGLTFLGLVSMHLFFNRKSLKNAFSL